ncbi:MAG: addiction module protein [Gemmataceae bacterium]|nr:addiction module protein [Gemmataceae bacterium]
MSDFKPSASPDFSFVLALSPAEQLELAEAFWDDIAANHPEAIPISDDVKAELFRREAKFRANPAAGLTWDEVKRNVLNHYGR